jgi:hypothetical protein
MGGQLAVLSHRQRHGVGSRRSGNRFDRLEPLDSVSSVFTEPGVGLYLPEVQRLRAECLLRLGPPMAVKPRANSKRRSRPRDDSTLICIICGGGLARQTVPIDIT